MVCPSLPKYVFDTVPVRQLIRIPGLYCLPPDLIQTIASSLVSNSLIAAIHVRHYRQVVLLPTSTLVVPHQFWTASQGAASIPGEDRRSADPCQPVLPPFHDKAPRGVGEVQHSHTQPLFMAYPMLSLKEPRAIGKGYLVATRGTTKLHTSLFRF